MKIWNNASCPKNLALFLPFSCNQSLQLSAYACKADGSQTIEDTS
jgi:hypothetical protein